jgi:transposase
MTRGILLNGPERRRKWHESQRREIVSLAFSAGSSVAEIARQFDVSTSLIYIWRRQFRSSDGEVSFNPAVVIGASSGSGSGLAAVTVDMNTGVRISIGAAAPLDLVTSICDACDDSDRIGRQDMDSNGSL